MVGRSRYFPLSKGPYTLDLNDECYLFLTDSDGVVVWESMFDESPRPQPSRPGYPLNADPWYWGFSGQTPDPSVWPEDGVVYDGDGNGPPPTASPP